jgi:hypothetical protein
MEVEIGYDVYNVVFEEEPKDDDGSALDGYYSHEHSQISITTKATPRRQKQLLLHEVLHGISDILNIGLEEKQIDTLSVGLLLFLWNNKDLIDTISDKDKPLE